MTISSALVMRLLGELTTQDQRTNREAKKHAQEARMASEERTLEAKKDEYAFDSVADTASVVVTGIERLPGPDEAKKAHALFENATHGAGDPKKLAREQTRKVEEADAHIAASAGRAEEAVRASADLHHRMRAVLRGLLA